MNKNNLKNEENALKHALSDRNDPDLNDAERQTARKFILEQIKTIRRIKKGEERARIAFSQTPEELSDKLNEEFGNGKRGLVHHPKPRR